MGTGEPSGGTGWGRLRRTKGMHYWPGGQNRANWPEVAEAGAIHLGLLL